MTDARQAGEITARYRDLQGLRQAAAGIGLLVLFAYEMVAPLSGPEIRAAGIGPTLWGLAVVVLGFVVTGLAIVRVSAWYRRRYGLVEQTTRQRRLGMLIGGTGTLAFLVPFNVDSIAMNSGHTLPVNLMDFTLALWIIGYWWYIGRSFRHYLVLAGIGLVLGFLSIAGIPPATFAWHLREATLYFALATIAGGLIDHRILTSALQDPEERIGLES
jgi:hypothetical protein